MKEFIKRQLYWFRSFRARYGAARKSYAQAGEDVKAIELLGTVKSFIDIGANDGFTASNSFLFALHGAEGICLEPVPAIYQRLRTLHHFNPKVKCLNYGISNSDTETEIVASGLLSYLPGTQDQKLMTYLGDAYAKVEEKVGIRLISFATLATMVPIPPLTDVLSVDVEGHELQVLQSIDFDRYQFRLIIVETHARSQSGEYHWVHRDLTDIEQLLGRHGYHSVATSSINTLYMQTEG